MDYAVTETIGIRVRGGMHKSALTFLSAGLPVTRPDFCNNMKKKVRGYQQSLAN
jgi:hypothetical protein